MRDNTPAADVLVVDDEPDIRRCLAWLLGRQGYLVATAADGREALDYVGRHGAPRLILLDLVMPEMDGWDFLRERRRDEELAAVPVVVLSAVTQFSAPDPRELGAAAVLDKAAGLHEVVEVARRHCLTSTDA